MKAKVIFSILMSSCLLAGAAEPKLIFDGKTFAGWEGDTNKTWRIQDGALGAGSLKEKIPRNEFLCTTRSYTNFVLSLQFKLVGAGVNSGVQFRTKRIPNHHEVIGYQADLGDPGWWGSIYDESRRNKVLAQSDMKALGPVIKRNDWNDYVIRADGPRITTWINGVQGVDYIEADPRSEERRVGKECRSLWCAQ